MSILSSTNQKLIELWDETDPQVYFERAPLLIESLEKNAILFVGMNPSFTWKEPKRNEFRYDRTRKPGIYEIIALEGSAKETYHKYYNRPRSMVEESDGIGGKAEFLDLFPVRETSQAKVKERLLGKGEKLTPFAEVLMRYFRDLLFFSEPRAIVVCNAKASSLFKDYFQLGDLDPEQGCHFIVIETRQTPVFLGSMLSGQRALDNHSFARLKWHIKKVLEEWPSQRF